MYDVANLAVDLVEVDGEGSVGLCDERSFVGQVVELENHASAMSFVDAESEGAERRGEECRV